MPTQRFGLIGLDLFHASLAQSVEHAAVNRRVVGSSPTGGAKSGLPPEFDGKLLLSERNV